MISNRTQVQDAKQTFNTHAGRPLIGIYNIVDKSITLFPCISERTRLDEDAHGMFTQGSYINEYDEQTKLLTPEELAEANRLGYAPRYLDLPLGTTSPYTGATFLSAHEYVTRLMGVTTPKEIANLRGFTVTQKTLGSEPVFQWASGSLNSPRTKSGELLERIRGCEVAPSLQKEIKDIIKPWGQNLIGKKTENSFCQKITNRFYGLSHSLLFRDAPETTRDSRVTAARSLIPDLIHW